MAVTAKAKALLAEVAGWLGGAPADAVRPLRSATRHPGSLPRPAPTAAPDEATAPAEDDARTANADAAWCALPDRLPPRTDADGIFLTGAYQETLGDLHNLFGDTHLVHIRYDDDEGWFVDEVVEGDSVGEVLGYLAHLSSGDARIALNALEMSISSSGGRIVSRVRQSVWPCIVHGVP